jgi:hypothetical protein
MAWQKVKKISFSSKEPFISIHNNRFNFNLIFSRMISVEKHPFVVLYIDNDERKIGFEFCVNENSDSRKIIGDEKKGFYCQSKEISDISWVKNLNGKKGLNTFKPLKEGNKWVISLMPSFETSVDRDAYTTIPSDSKGLYRYLDGDEVVYIGIGNIRKRYLEAGRKDWIFDKIQYSIVLDKNDQKDWEGFWIQKCKAENGDALPRYNRNSGKSSEFFL